MKKRKLFLGVLLASALIGVAACNNNNNDADNTDDKSSETQVTKYTVTFNVNGGTGTVAPQEVEENSKATRPTTNPTKTATAAESYTFAGWYTDAAGTTAFNFDTAITGDITLYAKYTSSPVQYTVTFESNGGSAVQSVTVNYNGTVTKPTDPSKDPAGNVKYAFAGWYKEAALTNEFDFTNDKITAATTLYAKWEETEKVSVIFNSKGGSAVDTQLVFPGETATEPTAPTKTADDEYKYSFEGWYTDENCTQAFSFSTVIEGNLTLYANWTATPVTKYTVQFDTKGGSAVDPVQVIEGRTVSKPSTNPTKESDMDYIYTFKNWYKDEACTTVFDFANETIEENTTIYAGWTQATRSWFVFNVNSDNVTKEIEIGNKLDLAGLVVSAVDNKGKTQTLSDSDYTVTVTDPNGTAFDINDDTATAGNYTVKVAFKTFNKTFTIEAKQPQYKYSFKLTAHDYNQSLETPHTAEYLFPAGTTTLFDNKSFTIAMTGVTSDNKQAKFQLGNDRELDGVTYTDRIQIHKSNGQMTITAKKSGTVVLYATVGSNDGRNLTIKNKTTGDTTECPTDWDKDSLYKYEFAVEAGTDYEISVSTNGALIYGVEFNGSINASDRVATDEFKFVPTATQFDIDDVVFDTANVSGVATAWDNCGVQRNVELSDVTFTVKNSSDVAVTGQITTPDVYTVTAAYDGKEVTYNIVVEDKNAVITEVQVDSSAATKKFYEGQAAFDANGIVVTATKGVNISLTAEDYTVKLYKGADEVTAFDTTGEYTVRVYANGTDVYGTYTINYYQVTNAVINSGDTATVKVGITSFNSCAKANLVFADSTTKDVTDSITAKYYEDVDCTIEKANPFAAAGTVYLKLSITGASKVITITVADIAATAYTYDYTNTEAGTTGIDGTVWTATSATTTATIDGKVLVKLDLTNNVTLNLTTAANMIDLTLTGGTGGSSNASDYLKIEFLDADGNVIDTVIGTTPAGKVIGNITYKAYDGENTFTFTSATACKSIRFTCSTSGKSVGIATAAINAYTLSA